MPTLKLNYQSLENRIWVDDGNADQSLFRRMAGAMIIMVSYPIINDPIERGL